MEYVAKNDVKQERKREAKEGAAPMRHPHLGGWDHKKGPQQEEK